MQGQDYTLRVYVSGKQLPAEVYINTSGNTFKLTAQGKQWFTYTFTNVQQNINFSWQGGGFASANYTLQVGYKPTLLKLSAVLQYPAYIHKPTQTINNVADITAPKGTVVSWQVQTQYAAALQFTLNGQLLNTRGNNGVFRVKATNAGTLAGDSASYAVQVITDSPPQITVEQKTDSASSKALYFTGKLADDYGFSSLTLHYTINLPDTKTSQSVSLPIKADLQGTATTFFFYWDLKQLKLQPGTELTYYFDVADNDAIDGPQHVRSAQLVYRQPTATQLNQQLDAGAKAVQQQMQSAMKLSGQIEHEAQKLAEQLISKNALDFDGKKQVENLLQKRRELEDMVNTIKNQNEQNLLNRDENKANAAQLAEKQKLMNDLLNGLLDPKTRQLLQDLQKLLDNNQKNEAQQQLGQMQTDSKVLKKELDRMLQLYKQLQFEQKLNDNVDRLQNLSQQLQNLAKQSATKTTPQMLQQQQNINSEFNEVKKALNELQQQNQQLDEPENFKEPIAEEKAIDEQLNNSQQQLQQNQGARAAKAQQQAAQQMQQLAQNMQQSQQQAEAQQNQLNLLQLRVLIKALVNSSFEQERLMQVLKLTKEADPSYIRIAQQQQNIKDNLKNAQDSLYSLSKRVPQLQATVNKEIGNINASVDKALANLADRQTAQAGSNQQYAMTAMNNLALMLDEVLQQLQNNAKNGRAGRGKGKLPSLAQLQQMQQRLNQNMQQMRNQMQQQGNQGKVGQQPGNSEQLARLAQQQQMIRQLLQQINSEERKAGNGSLGDLNNVIKQMEQTEKDIVNRQILQQTLQRQQQINTRLLQAANAQQQRGEDTQRQSNAGKQLPPGYIKALQQYNLLKKQQTEQIRTETPWLNFYYKEKIKLYFDLINGKWNETGQHRNG